MLVLKLTGKAKQVFKYLDLLAKYQGDKTLGQIIKEREGNVKDSSMA